MPRPLPHDRSSRGSSCLFLPQPSEPVVPLVGHTGRQRVTRLDGRGAGRLSGVLLLWQRRRRLVSATPRRVQSGRHLTGGRSRRVVITRRRCLWDCRQRRGAERQRVTRLVGRGDGWLGGVLLWR